MLKIYLIRHAESEGNVNHHLIGGQSNHYPLTARGESQARRLGARFLQEQLSFEQIYSSTAVRTQQTCSITCAHLLNSPPPSLDERLLELSQGEWEGKVRTDMYTAERLAVVRSDPFEFKPPGGESQREVETRMYDWLSQVSDMYDDTSISVNIAAFSHGFAIKTLIRSLLEASPMMPYQTNIHNTSLTVLYRDSGTWFIERVNDFQHIIGTDFIGHY